MTEGDWILWRFDDGTVWALNGHMIVPGIVFVLVIVFLTFLATRPKKRDPK